MAARIAGSAARSNQTLQFQSAQADELSNQISSLGVDQTRLSDIAGGSWLQIAATCLLLWLILLPYFAFRQISEVLGQGNLRRMFFVEG
jgi:hypothetical protein